MIRVAAVLLLCATMAGTPARAADTTPAVVTGAEVLYVRRGPGLNFPAFATIDRGERVEVEQLEGVWALVRLASGQTGYVHSNFLTFPGEGRATIVVPATITATKAAPPTPTRTAVLATVATTPTPSPTSVIPVAGSVRAGGEAPVSESSPPPAQSGETSETDLASVRRDIQQLTAAVTTLHARLGDPTDGPADLTGEYTWRSPLLILLLLFAFLLGWVSGGAYGRQAERTRRGRIRL